MGADWLLLLFAAGGGGIDLGGDGSLLELP